MIGIEKALEIAPDMPLLWSRKAQIYQMLNRMDEAFECLDRPIELAPNWAVPLQSKAEMLIVVNENEEVSASRSWPQTEYAKAALVLARHGDNEAASAVAGVVHKIMDTYPIKNMLTLIPIKINTESDDFIYL